MAAATEHIQTSFSATVVHGTESFARNRIVPISNPTSIATSSTIVSAASSLNMSAPSVASEPMDVTTPTNTSPAAGHSVDADGDVKPADHSKSSPPRDLREQSSLPSGMNMSAPPPAAAAVHQPKIVQTAFIHKLYNMLEDPNIQHLISWSSTADSFVMSPSPDFSKVLSYVRNRMHAQRGC
jgi:hypothetical protein